MTSMVRSVEQFPLAVAGDGNGLTLEDPVRLREIPLKIYYPEPPGNYPLILFSHGLGGSKDGYRYLVEGWVRAGYVVMVPTHLGSDQSIFQRGHQSENLRTAKESTLDPKNWRDRPTDLSFLLASLAEVEAAVPALKGKIDPARTGVGGHSFGSYTAMALAGMKVNLPSGLTSFRNEKPCAFVGISPQGEGEIPSGSEGWAAIDRPFLALTGTEDRGFDGQPSEWRLQAYAHMKPGDKYQAVIAGADHQSFAGRGPAHTPERRESVVQLSLAFWDAYLKKDAQAKRWLVARVQHK